jgi:hypothetical protein
VFPFLSIFEMIAWLRVLLVKVKLFLFLTKHYVMKRYWGSGVIAPRILDIGTTWR